MMLILIGIVLGIVWGIYAVYKENKDEDFKDMILVYIVSSIMGIFIFGLIGLILAFILPMNTYNKLETSLNIETLQDNNSVNGHFYLGCGQIEGVMKYVFYYEENGFYKMEQLDYNLVKIKYSNNTPKVHIFSNYPTDEFINNFALDFKAFKKTYIIEVPKGTIQNNYNLDAK